MGSRNSTPVFGLKVGHLTFTLGVSGSAGRILFELGYLTISLVSRVERNPPRYLEAKPPGLKYRCPC